MPLTRKNLKSILLTELSLVIIILCPICELLSMPPPPVEEEISPSWSPDGKRIAYTCYIDGPTMGIAESDRSHYTAEAADICTIEVNGSNRVRMTNDAGAEYGPVWSPDGSQIAYTRDDGIYIINADGSKQHQLVYTNNEYTSVAWSPDGKQLLFSAYLGGSNSDIYLVNVSTGDLTNLTSDNGAGDSRPMWTLDGTKIVFVSSSETAREQLKIINVDGSSERTINDTANHYLSISVSNGGQIAFSLHKHLDDSLDYLYTIGIDDKEPVRIFSTHTTDVPSWSPNGKYLMYEEGGNLKVLEVETGEIRGLPSLSSGYICGVPRWSPDGQQIAVTTCIDPTGFYEESHIHIVDLQNGTFRRLVQK
jgi:Tol biopolymer transport system component